MKRPALSFNTRKSLCNHLGETAGNELADLLQSLASRMELLERNKVDVTPIVPLGRSEIRLGREELI